MRQGEVIRKLWAVGFVSIVFPATLTLLAGAQQSRKPLSRSDVVYLLGGQVAPTRVETTVRERGIDFQVTPDVEKELRKFGATDEIVQALRELAPKPPAATGGGAALGGLIGAIAGQEKGEVIGSAAGSRQSKEVRLPAGARLDFTLDRPVTISP